MVFLSGFPIIVFTFVFFSHAFSFWAANPNPKRFLFCFLEGFFFSDLLLQVVSVVSDCITSAVFTMEQLTETLTRTLGWTEGEKNLVAADPAHAAKPTNDQSLSLIGKVITDRELSMNFIRANVTRLLRPVRQIQIRGIAENMFVMKFEHPLDMKNALKGCPWVLDKHALILEPVDPAKNLADHKLTWLPLVTRVHQLSLANRSEQVARLIGDRLGMFVELPKLSESFYSPHFRIKILVDVTMPLKRGINFQGVDGKKEWLSVTYERLPIFRFLCGVIGHMEDKCPARYEEGFLEPE